MERHIRYHEVKSTARDMVKSAWAAGCMAVEKMLVGAPPKNAVDYSGKPQRDVDAIRLVVDTLPQIERTEAAQLGHTALNRWDDMGNYHE